ncbi:MAG: hypothetical protein P1U35_02000 [Cycloclasticus sp.]|nr:hypothetical protein [Cycloclasticus sp.]
MQSLEDLSSYTSVFEQMQELPGGLPLHKRPSLPEYLSVDEISRLLYDTEEGQNNVKQLLGKAITKGELHITHVFVGGAPADPSMVVRNLHSHIRLLEKEFHEFKNDIANLVQKNVKELENDIRETKDSIEKEVKTIILEGGYGQSETNSSLNRRKWSGRQFTPKSRLPLRGRTGIGYETDKTSITFQLTSSENMQSWLIAKNEWPLHESTPLYRWFVKTKKTNSEPLVNTFREDVIKLVAEDLKSQGIDPLAFSGKVAEVFTMCKGKAFSINGNWHGFTQENTWRTAFWNSSKKPNPKGILELKSSRSWSQKS